MDKGLDLFICLIPHLTQTFDRQGHHRPSPVSHTFLFSFPLSLALPNRGNPHYVILDVIRMIIFMTKGGSTYFSSNFFFFLISNKNIIQSAKYSSDTQEVYRRSA